MGQHSWTFSGGYLFRPAPKDGKRDVYMGQHSWTISGGYLFQPAPQDGKRHAYMGQQSCTISGGSLFQPARKMACVMLTWASILGRLAVHIYTRY